MRRTYRYFSLLLLLVSCHKKPGFVQKYRDTDFSVFKGMYLFVRGFDHDKDPVVMIVPRDMAINDTNCFGSFVVIVDDDKVKQSKRLVMSDSCPIDEDKLRNCAVLFCKFNINKMEVDSNLNVYIGEQYDKDFNIVKTTDNKLVAEKYKGWDSLGQGWYQKHE